MNTEEWNDWAAHPGTKSFLKLLEQMVLIEKIERRNFTDENTLKRDFYTSTGFCNGLEEIMDLISSKKETH